MEIKSKEKLPFLFKNCTEGFISENPFMFTDKSSSFKQSLTEQQFNKLSEFNVNKVVEVSEAVDEKANSEDDNALAEINLLERQAAKMIKNSNAQKKLLKRIAELKAAKGKK